MFLFSLKNFSENIWTYAVRTVVLLFITLIFFIYFQKSLTEEKRLFEKSNFIPEGDFVFEKQDKSLITSEELNQLEAIFRQYENKIEKYALYTIFSGLIDQNRSNWNFTGISINPEDIEFFFKFDSNISLKNLENGIAINEVLKNRFPNIEKYFQLHVLSKDFESNIFSSVSLQATAIFNENINRASLIIPTTLAEPLLQNGLANRGVVRLSSKEELSEIEYQLNQFGFHFIKFEKMNSIKAEICFLFILVLIFAILISKPVQKMSWLSIYYSWKSKDVFYLKFIEVFFATLLLFLSLFSITIFFQIPISTKITSIFIISFIYFLSGILKRS